MKVAESPKKFIFLPADLGTIEKNIINKSRDLISSVLWCNITPQAGAHSCRISPTDKIIMCLGMTISSLKKALGGQYGCLYIDEINIADMEFVREAAMRCDYMVRSQPG